MTNICKSSVSRQKAFVFLDGWSKPLGFLQTLGLFSFTDVKSGSLSKSCHPEEKEVEEENRDLYERKCEKKWHESGWQSYWWPVLLYPEIFNFFHSHFFMSTPIRVHMDIFSSLLAISDTQLAMLLPDCSTILGQSKLLRKEVKAFCMNMQLEMFPKILCLQ